MKKIQVLSFFLCLGILSQPLQVSAENGFSWKTVETGESADDETDDEDDEDKEDANEEDAEADDEDSESSDEDDESSDEKKVERPARSKAIYPSGKSIYSKSKISEMISEKYGELNEARYISDPFKKTKSMDRINSFILNFSGDVLANKKIAFLGDSITAGNGGTLTLDGSGLNYTDYISHYTSADIVNLGIGGTPFDGYDNDDALVYRYGDIPDDTDIIVIFAGINDLFAGSEHFGSMEDPQEGTYCGDVYKTFTHINDYYEDAEVYIVITFPNKMEEYTQFTGENWQDYADVQIELADELDFHVIDLYADGFMNSKDATVRNAFFKDDIHPDDLGSEVLGRHLLVQILKDYL